MQKSDQTIWIVIISIITSIITTLLDIRFS